MNILVVDDEYGPRESLRMILKKQYTVFTADSGEKAIEIFNRFPIDMVTLDIMMPGINGMDLLKYIRERDQYIDVILISGYGAFEHALEGIRYGIMDFITKPFSVPEILEIVINAEKRKHLREDTDLNSLRNKISVLENKLTFFSQTTRVGELAALYAHEIKNPLGAISLRAQAGMMAVQTRNLNSLEKHFETIMTQTERISKITNSLLRISHPESEKKDKANVHTILEELIDFFAIQLRTKQITIQKRFNRSIPPVFADQDSIFQVFLNITLNAFKVLDEGGVLSIKTGLEKNCTFCDSEMIRIDFKDNGPGIPKEFHEKVFEPFFTTNKNSGSGLGLYGCRKILTAHDGTITVNSTPGKGSTFSVFLPKAMDN